MLDASSHQLRAGSRGLILAETARAALPVREAAPETLRHLMQVTGETSYLTVVDGSEAVRVDCIESPQAFRVAYHVGQRHALGRAAPGLVLAAYGSPPAAGALLTSVRQKGWAGSSDQLQLGATGIAAPVFDYTGQAVAAIGIVGPSVRIRQRRELLLQEVVNAASRVSTGLGFRQRPRAQRGSGP